MIAMTRSEFSRRNLIGLPNLLTYFRLATIPVIVLVLIPPASADSLNLAFVLFLIASITDYLDGILARRHNLVTSSDLTIAVRYREFYFMRPTTLQKITRSHGERLDLPIGPGLALLSTGRHHFFLEIAQSSTKLGRVSQPIVG